VLVLPGDRYMEEKQTELETENKITLTSLGRKHVTLGIVECRK